MQEWPPQDDTNVNKTDDSEKEASLEESDLNNRRKYMLKKYNDVMGTDLPMTEDAYKSIGGSLGIVDKLASTEEEKEALKKEFLSITNTNPVSKNVETTENPESFKIKLDIDSLNIVEVREKITEDQRLYELYNLAKKQIIDETGVSAVERKKIVQRLISFFEGDKPAVSKDSPQKLYPKLMEILYSSVNYESDNYADYEKINLDEMDLSKISSTVMASEMKKDPLLKDFYEKAKSDLVRETGLSGVERKLIIARVIESIEDGKQTFQTKKLSNLLRVIYYKTLNELS